MATIATSPKLLRVNGLVPVLSGCALSFIQPTPRWLPRVNRWGVERCAREAVQLNADVQCLVGHDPQEFLGSTRLGNFYVSIEPAGVSVELALLDDAVGERTYCRALDCFFVGWSTNGPTTWDGERVASLRIDEISLAWEPLRRGTSLRLELLPRTAILRENLL